jgi:hypothetical protein
MALDQADRYDAFIAGYKGSAPQTPQQPVTPTPPSPPQPGAQPAGNQPAPTPASPQPQPYVVPEYDKTTVDCKIHNDDGKTCQDVNVSPGSRSCMWNQTWECVEGCAKWVKQGCN